MKVKKPVLTSLGSLATLDNLDCVSDTASDESVSQGPSILEESAGPEPTEGDAGKDLEDTEGGHNEERNILMRLGFSDNATGEPLLPVCAQKELPVPTGQPPAYKNLFWRKFLASRQPFGTLTADRLKLHEKLHPTTPQSLSELVDKTLPSASAGEMLAGFKFLARSVPVRDFATRIFGTDLGSDVAGFIGIDALASLSDIQDSSIDPMDSQDGRRVTGSRYIRLPTGPKGSGGRAGFLMEDDVSISTPGPSSVRGGSAKSDADDEEDVRCQGSALDSLFPPIQAVAEMSSKKAFNGMM